MEGGRIIAWVESGWENTGVGIVLRVEAVGSCVRGGTVEAKELRHRNADGSKGQGGAHPR